MNNRQKLFELAASVYDRAYAPYSGFKVAAALMTAAGNCYTGVNVENVSFPEGTCAETGAVAAMAAAGEREIAEILVLAGGSELITPCGGCRQRLKEFSGPDTLVHLADPQGVRQTCKLSDLLPHSFDGGF